MGFESQLDETGTVQAGMQPLPIWWRNVDEDEFGRGWLLESHAEGAAFLYEGTAPQPNTAIVTSTSDPASLEDSGTPVLVRKVDHIQDDMFLVATEYMRVEV